MEEMLPHVLAEVHQAGFLQEYILFNKLMSEGAFPFENIAFLLFLDVIKWHNNENIQQMRYSDTVKSFWKLGYRLFHGRFLRFMGGVENDHNFIVPDRKILTSADIIDGLHSTSLTPGIMPPMINLFPKGSILKIAVDGKQINATTDQQLGQVNLWGHETQPTADERMLRLETEHKLVKALLSIIECFDEKSFTEAKPCMKDRTTKSIKSLINTLSLRIKDKRQLKVSMNRRLLGLQKQAGENWRKTTLAQAISRNRMRILLLDNCIHAMLTVNDKALGFLAICNGAGRLFCSEPTLNLQQQQNLACLGDILIDLMSSEERHNKAFQMPHAVRQRTEEWHAIRNTALATGSTL
jgi:hypothetical protein